MSRAQPPEREPPSQSLGVPHFWVIIAGLSSAVTMPIRYGEGLQGVTRHGFFAVLMIFSYALLVPCPALLTYGLLFIAIAALKRFTTLFRHHFGNRQLSGYEGWPLICLIGIPNGFARQVIEPGLVWLLGQYLRQFNRPLGWFFLAGAAAAAIKTLFETIIERQRDLSMSDMRIRMEIDARERAKRGW